MEGLNEYLRTTTSWSMTLGDYRLECATTENPMGTYTVTVLDNGREVARQVFEGTIQTFNETYGAAVAFQKAMYAGTRHSSFSRWDDGAMNTTPQRANWDGHPVALGDAWVLR